MWQPEKLEQYKSKLEEVKEVVGVVIAVVTIASFVRKRVGSTSTPVSYGWETSAGVENILNQFGDDATYNISVKENNS